VQVAEESTFASLRPPNPQKARDSSSLIPQHDERRHLKAMRYEEGMVTVTSVVLTL